MSNPKTRSNWNIPFCIRRVKTGPDRCVAERCAECVGFSEYEPDVVLSTLHVQFDYEQMAYLELK